MIGKMAAGLLKKKRQKMEKEVKKAVGPVKLGERGKIQSKKKRRNRNV